MHERLWKLNDPDLASIYAIIDRENISKMEIVHKVYEVAQQFGCVTKVEIHTASVGDDAFTEMNIEDSKGDEGKRPSAALVSFVTSTLDVTQMHFELGTFCVDETGGERWMARGVTLSFYIEPNGEEWGFYIDINTDLFVPFRRVRDERTERLARLNAPKLKRLIHELLRTFQVVDWEWEYSYRGLKEYLEQIG
ncbi:hypothetical protein [Staphylospora marina]|uniref:hypothetical protein n=1 Tax=Staphylospora marina TaxID=2490858 RepID=UPI000F5C03BC|nr:hypothetical protein [Staphylospora marina]